MTSPFATDYVDSGLRTQNFLEVDTSGYPLQKQVPTTVQNYTGVGNVTIGYTGENVLAVTSTPLVGGAITIHLTAQQFTNCFGRRIDFIHKWGTGANSITLNVEPAAGKTFRYHDDTGTNVHLPEGSSCSLVWVDINNCYVTCTDLKDPMVPILVD